MAKEFYLIENYKKNGKIGIYHQVFEEIARYIAVEVDGVEFLEETSSLFKKQDIVCKIIKDEVYISINVRIRYNFNVGEVSQIIQDRVSQMIHQLTEIMPKKVDVNVVDIR